MKNIKFKKLIVLWGPVFVWLVVIFLFSQRPTVQTSEVFWQDFLLKKSAHIFEYALLTLLLFRALKESGMDKKNATYVAIFFSVIYGILDEYHQSFIPGRGSTGRDVIFDTIGSVLSMYALWKLLPKAPKKLKIWAEKLLVT